MKGLAIEENTDITVRVAVITGAARGIGIALLLASWPAAVQPSSALPLWSENFARKRHVRVGRMPAESLHGEDIVRRAPFRAASISRV